jgi:hypothetical protein
VDFKNSNPSPVMEEMTQLSLTPLRRSDFFALSICSEDARSDLVTTPTTGAHITLENVGGGGQFLVGSTKSSTTDALEEVDIREL